MASLLYSSNITNCRPKMGLQLLIVVGSWDGNAGSRIQYEQDIWYTVLVMVSLISIAMVFYLNGLSDSMLDFL